MDLNNYPRFKKFLAEHPEMNLYQAFLAIEAECKKRGILSGESDRDRQERIIFQ